jgi:hypothetical protein
MRVKPFGDLFVAGRTLMENGIFYVPVNIYDSNLKMIKEIYRVRRGVQVGGNRKQVMEHIKTDLEIKPYKVVTP